MIWKTPGVLLVLMFFAHPDAAEAGPGYRDQTTGMEFMLIKGGCFAMGDSIGDGDPRERPVHEACVGDFFIGTTEVTNAQYRQFAPGHNSVGAGEAQLGGDSQPVVNVSWEDAVAFAKWLSDKSGQAYRLPTEAEWEYAARAGTTQNRYWGNIPEESCKYANVADQTAKKQRPKWTAFPCDDHHAVSAPVGSFMPNGYGLHDMLGNVWEWCEDVYSSEAHAKLPKDNPVYQGAGKYRVMRGGGWSNGPLGIRSSHRVGLTPGFGHHALGFRLVKTVK